MQKLCLEDVGISEDDVVRLFGWMKDTVASARFILCDLVNNYQVTEVESNRTCWSNALTKIRGFKFACLHTFNILTCDSISDDEVNVADYLLGISDTLPFD